MCTLALYFHVLENYPLVVAANRDEHYDRPSIPPHLWRTSPEILAGKDLLAGGTWLGANEYGLTAGILNRRVSQSAANSSWSRVASLQSSVGRETQDTRRTENLQARPTRSRGLLCRDLLKFRSAAHAIDFVLSHGERYQPFTLVFADLEQAWVVYTARQELKVSTLRHGLHVFSNAEDFRLDCEKADRAFGLFAQLSDALRANCPGIPNWCDVFAPILADHAVDNGSADPKDSLCVHAGTSGTVSSSLIIYSRPQRQVQTFFCPGPPCRASFGQELTLELL